jgi:solute carrier family 25 oxoglutarate transporter 11
MIFNAVQMPTYSQVKQALISSGIMQQGLSLHVVASLVTTYVSLPIDIIKTRYQNMKFLRNGIPVSY